MRRRNADSRLDAHQHFWRIARGDYGWLTPRLDAIYRDFEPADLASILARHGIGRTILVQAAPTVAETRFLLEIAREARFVAGVVGWVDFAAADAAATIVELAQDPRLVGMRPMIQDIADDDWMLDPRLAPAFAALARCGLVFDALVLPRHLDRLATLAARHPEVTFVVDHAAKPSIRTGAIEPWRTHMRRLAARANVRCKLSGLATEAKSDWRVADLAYYVGAILEAFGPARVIWGSDWPVVNLAGGYDRWVDATAQLLAGLDPAERAQVLGENAVRTYLAPRRSGAPETLDPAG